MTARLISILGVLLLLTACQSTSEVRESSLKLRPGSAPIALMPMDIELYELSAGGVAEPMAHWTEQARSHVLSAVRKLQAERGVSLVDFDTKSLALEERRLMSQIVKLHSVVGSEILVQRYVPALRPPTKADGRFDWSIGPEVRRIGHATGARFALFVTMRDSYSTSGRVLLNIALAVLGGHAGGGQQIGYASLVDLNTGDIAWFGTLARAVGDLREAEPAEQTIRELFSGFPADSRPSA